MTDEPAHVQQLGPFPQRKPHREYLPVAEGNKARVPLTQGQVALIDSADAELVGRHCWCALWSRSTLSYYAATNIYRPDGRQTTLQMHRLILAAQRGQEVDHRNHDTLDNRRANLRCVTHSENQRNRKGANRNGTSGHLGVSWNKTRQRWHAYVWLNTRLVVIGYFNTAEMAARARDAYIRIQCPNDEHWTFNYPETP